MTTAEHDGRREAAEAVAATQGALVHLEGVSRRYQVGAGIVTALEDVTLDIGRGEFIVVLGPSGSGKTTLLNLIGALDTVTEGRIAIAGRDITAASRRDLFAFRRHTVSFIFQTFNLFPELSALENVEFGADVAGRGDRVAVATETLRRVGLEDRVAHFPHELSGGEQQRVAIARALATGNPILLADEPTGELDFHTGVQILQLLHDQTHELGTSVLVVTHNREIARVADRVIELSSGRVVVGRAAAGRPGRHRRAALVAPMDRNLWLRWSWRDLRRRPVQVVAIALVIAIGTGLATGLASMQEWRTLLQRRELRPPRLPRRARLAGRGRLRAPGSPGAGGRAAPDAVATRERLVLPTQVDASTARRAVLVPGCSSASRSTAPVVDGLAAARGRVLTAADDDRAVGMLESRFADAPKLPAPARSRSPAVRALRYVGLGLPAAVLLRRRRRHRRSGHGSRGLRRALHVAADRAADLGPRGRRERGRRARKPGVSEAQLAGAAAPGVRGLAARRRRDRDARAPTSSPTGCSTRTPRATRRSTSSSRRSCSLGAALAAYNLISRTVEAERREIGIGMALGVPPARARAAPDPHGRADRRARARCSASRSGSC